MRPKLTYANVTATLALIIAVGGASAFAATQLAKNSVGAKQIKKNAVTGAKVKNQSLTGSDINLAKLGTVPSATHAANATSADSIPPAEPIHLIGAPGEPVFHGGATNVPPAPSAGFYKDAFGIVHLEGQVKAGTSSVLFVLPPGYRPASGVVLFFEQTKEAPVTIHGSQSAELEAGAVLISGSPEVWLSGITFRAES